MRAAVGRAGVWGRVGGAGIPGGGGGGELSHKLRYLATKKTYGNNVALTLFIELKA
jgi:hypothetical protein